MTCRTLDWETAPLEELASHSHIATCAACQVRIDKLYAADAALRTHLGTSPGLALPEPRSHLPRAALALAAAAVLGVVTWSVLPPTDQARSAAALHPTEDLLEVFEEIDVDRSQSIEAQTASLKEVLSRKSAALTDLLEEAEAPCESDDPYLSGPCAQLLGEAKAHMGTWLFTSPVPPYLVPEQVEVYSMALEDKADRQWVQAEEALENSLDAAEQVEDAWWSEAAEDLLDEIAERRAEVAARVARQEAEEAARIEAGTALRPEMRRLTTELTDLLERCAPAPDARAMAEQVLQITQDELANGSGSGMVELHGLLEEQVATVRQTCP